MIEPVTLAELQLEEVRATPAFEIAALDADQYSLTLGGVAISRGAGESEYADGVFFTAMASNWFLETEGSDGFVVRSKSFGQELPMTLHLLQTSPTNLYLSQLLAKDVNQPGGVGVGSFEVRDVYGETIILCTRTWIQKPADDELEASATERVWSLMGIWSVYRIAGPLFDVGGASI